MAALIVTAALGAADLGRLDALRRAHFPPDRNQLPAHLTLFHALPPSAEGEARSQLARLAAAPAPRATLAAPYSLGGGVAYRVDSPELATLRETIADHFHGLLSAQDRAGWRAHITIQNKVLLPVAKALLNALLADHRDRPLAIRGIELHRYLGGPWQLLGQWRFRA